MLDHHIQRAIVYRLAFSDGLRFSELKPDSLENKLFDYHLKKVVSAGYVSKSEDGLYTLSAEGRLLGIRALDKPGALADQAESVLFLIVRRASDGAWLFYKRNTHPMLGFSGFMHTTPNAHETTPVTAARSLTEKTGLTGTFTALGGGYSRIFDSSGELLSFTHFTLLVSDDAQRELAAHDEFAEYYWEIRPDFAADHFFPTTPPLVTHYERREPFFEEFTFMV